MPYRVDISQPPADALDRFITLGALDVAAVGAGIAAIIPDRVSRQRVRRAFAGADVIINVAHGRDDDSLWLVHPRALRVRRFAIVPSQNHHAADNPIRLGDGPAFGTGSHPTTALCLEALDDELNSSTPASLLDVGTGTGILALAALHAGVARAVAVDIDADAIRVATDNAQLNGVSARLQLVRGGPEALAGRWPLVLANILAAPLIEMAPAIARLTARGGRLVLSGIHESLVADVERAYRRVGMRQVRVANRDGWIAVTLGAW